MGIKGEKKNTSSILRINGDMTIAMAEELKGRLIKESSSAHPLLIELDNIESMDISCIQLLCSANRSYEKLQKTIVLHTENSKDMVERSLTESGYDQNGSCPEAPCKRCLWKGDNS